MATLRRQGGVQNRRDAHDDHVARGINGLFPVRHHRVVAPWVERIPSLFRRLLDQVVATHSQVHLPGGAQRTGVSNPFHLRQ